MHNTIPSVKPARFCRCIARIKAKLSRTRKKDISKNESKLVLFTEKTITERIPTLEPEGTAAERDTQGVKRDSGYHSNESIIQLEIDIRHAQALLEQLTHEANNMLATTTPTLVRIRPEIIEHLDDGTNDSLVTTKPTLPEIQPEIQPELNKRNPPDFLEYRRDKEPFLQPNECVHLPSLDERLTQTYIYICLQESESCRLMSDEEVHNLAYRWKGGDGLALSLMTCYEVTRAFGNKVPEALVSFVQKRVQKTEGWAERMDTIKKVYEYEDLRDPIAYAKMETLGRYRYMEY